VIFTTQERDHVIRADPELAAAINLLKTRWLVGLHHNWHDFSFTYDPLYDFSMAGQDDLREVSGRPVPLVELDACNFVPGVFRPSDAEPFWDILYVARPVGFKRLPEFLRCIRTLYDQKHLYRVLLISPMPPYDPSEAATVFYDLRKAYESMFSTAEQSTFTLLDLTFNYPFPFDLETLAHFYRSSRVFVHFADHERRCRVAAYAWASGLPVVGMSSVGSLLPPSARTTPAFYDVSAFKKFPDVLVRALQQATPHGGLAARRFVAAEDTVPALLDRLGELLGSPLDASERAAAATSGLDIRLGRHHGLAAGPNAVSMTVSRLVALLDADEATVSRLVTSAADPEVALAATDARGTRRRGRFWSFH
jgi:hypothetical protein